jgi:26S proteasome regulatory subunit N10
MKQSMSDSGGQAIVFLIDNSATSIDGDFYPNRLDAQRHAIVRLSSYYLGQSPQTQVGFGTMGGTDCGIRCCLTNDCKRFSRSVDRVSYGGECFLDRALRCAVLLFPGAPANGVIRRIIALIGSPTRLTRLSVFEFAKSASESRIEIDVFGFGEDIDAGGLSYLVGQVSRKSPSRFVICPVGGPILCDALFGSVIGPGLEAGRRWSMESRDDLELAATIQLSITEQRHNGGSSRGGGVDGWGSQQEENFGADEVDLMLAIEASIADQRKPPDERDKPDGTGEEDKANGG